MNKKTEWILLKYDDKREFWISMCNAVFDWWLPQIQFAGHVDFLNSFENQNVYRKYGSKYIKQLKKEKCLVIIYKDICEKMIQKNIRNHK